MQTQDSYQSLYRQHVLCSPYPCCVLNKHGMVLETSNDFVRLFGYADDEILVGSNFYDIFSADDIADARAYFAKVLQQLDCSPPEYQVLHKAAGTAWLEISGKAMSDAEDVIHAIFVVGRDISARKKTEQVLKKSEVHYRRLIESARSAIVHLSPDGHILFINKFAEDFFGFAPGELIGKHVVGSIVPEIESMTNRDLKQMIEDVFHDTNNHQISINENMRKNGERVWFAWSNGAIFDAQGQLTEVCSIGHDLTEERLARQQLEEAHELLKLQYAEIQNLQTKLQEQVTRDPLTNLFNRRYLDDTFNRELARCQREQMPIAIVIMDIDYFKKINDAHGHEAGDLVLRSAAMLLKNMTRGEDIICRYGGEEFLAVLPGASLRHAEDRAESWRIAFAALIFDYKGQHIRATLSCGVSAYPPHSPDQDTLIRLADDALYRAKDNGRNLVCTAPTDNDAWFSLVD